MLKSLLFSNLSFAIKAIAALSMSVLLANSLSISDFALWSLLISISLYFTLSDMGIGQYLLRTMVAYRSGELESATMNARIGAANTVLIFVVFVFFVFGGALLISSERFEPVGVVNLVSFMLLVLARSLLIPYLAQLSAYEKFHIRKNIEAIGATLSLVVVWMSIKNEISLIELINLYQLTILLSSFSVIIFCSRYGFPNLAIVSNNFIEIKSAFRSSFPYFVNNLSLLITRGGMVFLVGLIVADNEITQLAVFYALFFQVIYQFFDILIRTIQPKILTDNEIYKKSLLFMYFILILFVVASSIFGLSFLSLFYPKIDFSFHALVAFLLLSVSEVIFTSINAKWQMYSSKNKMVVTSSVFKSLGYLLVVFLFSGPPENVSLAEILVLFFISNVLSMIFAMNLGKMKLIWQA
ncbi:hypothetical protein FXF09_02475 [Vibrio cholerae]|uniref:hypothetical protein n=1 Tax=Vibrio cholerae TaxID=666 RepID=UPI0011DAD4E0|nr:hypothetical protein [Vibrio cholerae]TXX51664.1 hypothetical protein FXF09_02475 [Vibrio cholerae]BCN18040.1 putative O-antigen flippase [Vibrio cholerae]GIC36258.1 hypothetical protein VCSRO148_2126 [Vibrio cholerae]